MTTLTSASLAATFGLLTSGLILAMLGAHYALLQAPLALAVGIATFRLLPRNGRGAQRRRGVPVVMLLLVAAVTLTNLGLRSEQVIAGRDGATYANTASFLVDEAGLFPAAIEEPFAGSDVEFGAPGFVPRSDGRFWQQFLHSMPALYGFFGEIFGKSALFMVNALLSGVAALAIFSLASRFMTAWWAVLATAATAVSLPFAYYARGTFSEMATLVMSIGGLWVGHVALRSGSTRYGVGAGILLGGAAIVRVDGWMIGVALGLFVVSTAWLGEREAKKVAERMFVGFAAVAALGLIDMVLFSEPYLVNVGIQFLALVVVAIALRLFAPVAATAPMQRALEVVRPRAAHIATAVSVVMVAAFLFAWLVRPQLAPNVADGVYGLEGIQLREGLELQPTRTYAELSVWWLVWYLGVPVIGFGMAGIAVALRRSLLTPAADMRFAVFFFLVPAVTYLWRPSINPDQIWAIRRFLPVVIPVLVIAAFATAAALASRLPQTRRSHAVAAGLILVLVAPTLLPSSRLIGQSDRAGLGDQMGELCEVLGASRSVLIIDGDPDAPLWWRLGPPLRSWCRVSVAGATPGTVLAVRPDVFLSDDPGLLPTEPETSYEFVTEVWRSRLTGPPLEAETQRLRVWIDETADPAQD